MIEKWNRLYRASALLLCAASVISFGCQPMAAQPVAQPGQPTLIPTAVLPTDQPAPTHTARPTNEATPTNTATQTAVPATLTAVPSPTATPSPAPTSAGAPCPDPVPLKPDYQRYFLSPDPWPTPDVANRQAHFWLGQPMSGETRLLINKTYPYGHDGNGRYLLHNGVDAAEALGTPVLAVGDGTVIVAQNDSSEMFGWRCDWYGHLIIVQLDKTWQNQPMYALYGHVLNINVAVGDRVQQGDQLAEVGVGGAARVPHLHFELRVGKNSFNSTRNPVLWMTPGEEHGVIVGRLVDPAGRPWQGAVVTLVGPDGAAEFINTYTYLDDPQHLINPDEWFAENFVFADVEPGVYAIDIRLQGVTYRDAVTVHEGKLSFIDIVTEPYRTPTAVPEE